jgi:catechol 2,3-dioxygenase-like lactoylglutathione lyase family enzyme
MAGRDELPQTAAAAIPGVAGIEHIGLTVPDVDAATRFFIEVLGGEALYDIGPFASPDDWMAAHLAVHPLSRIRRLRVLKVANGPTLELFEFENAVARATESAATGWHVAFYVDDMERALAGLRAHGVAIQSGPVTMTEGPSAGLTWLYFTAPWGQQLELVSYPDGIEAYKRLRQRVWRPSHT